MKSRRTIQRHIKDLRKIIDASFIDDPILARIAYAMETALCWASKKTVGWQSMADEAKIEAKILKDQIIDFKEPR
jgi:hypothetical protein